MKGVSRKIPYRLAVWKNLLIFASKLLDTLTMKRTLISLLAIAAVLTVMLSCGHEQQQVASVETQADSIFHAAFDAKDYQRAIELCDSFEQTGDFTPVRAAMHRGYTY